MVDDPAILANTTQDLLTTCNWAAKCQVNDVLALKSGRIKGIGDAVIAGAAKIVVAEVMRRVATFPRDAAVEGARIAVITILRLEDTPELRVAPGDEARVGRRTEVVARGVHTMPLDALVEGAGVVVVAVGVGATPAAVAGGVLDVHTADLRIARINRAGVIVVTVLGCVDAAGRRIAAIVGARVAVITVLGRVNALSGDTVIVGAGVSVIAVGIGAAFYAAGDRGVLARVVDTGIVGAGVAVVAVAGVTTARLAEA
jgi:hypothetical protein